MKIGFVGLGNMGASMAANLLKAGHELTIWNRSPDKADSLIAAGARRASRVADTAGGDVVFSMLSNDAAVTEVVFGVDGLLAAGRPVTHVSMSTISVELANRLERAHHDASGEYLSAPVFGRPAAAAAGKLFMVVAGAPDVVARLTPAFNAMSQRLFSLGEKPSSANVVKLCGNFMILAAIESMGEAMALCQKSGIDKARLLEVLTGSLFGSPLYQLYGQLIVDGHFRPAGFAAPLGLKDMGLVADAASAARVPMPILGVLRDHLLDAIAHEGEDVDWSAIASAIDRSAAL